MAGVYGKNRYKCEGTVIGKQEEIERADAADELLTEEVRAMAISVHEKRHLLAQRLTPRMTLRTLEKHRDVLNRVVRVAREEYGIADELRIIGYRELQGVIEADRQDDDLYLRCHAAEGPRALDAGPDPPAPHEPDLRRLRLSLLALAARYDDHTGRHLLGPASDPDDGAPRGRGCATEAHQAGSA